jgi:hypothetical protein
MLDVYGRIYFAWVSHPSEKPEQDANTALVLSFSSSCVSALKFVRDLDVDPLCL